MWGLVGLICCASRGYVFEHYTCKSETKQKKHQEVFKMGEGEESCIMDVEGLKSKKKSTLNLSLRARTKVEKN